MVCIHSLDWYIYILMAIILVNQFWNKKKCLISDEGIRSPATTMSDSSMNTSLANLPEWMVVGENIRLKQTNCRCVNCLWLSQNFANYAHIFYKSFYCIFSGKIAFIGPTEFATGIWIGIELDSAIGKQKNRNKTRTYCIVFCLLSAISFIGSHNWWI